MSWRIRDLTNKTMGASLRTESGKVLREIKAIFADEDMKVSKGTTHVIQIAPVGIPKNYLTLIEAYARHPLGHVLAFVEEYPKRIEREREVREVVFLAWGDGMVEKGDVIGVVVLTHMGTLH